MTTDNVSEEQIVGDDAPVEPVEPTEPTEPTEEGTAAPRPTPGRLLGAQREALGMTVQQVAETLNLTRHFIRSLEEDRYDKLPDEVFVRGYIRSYGKLVNLDPAQLLDLYEEFTTKKQVRKEEAIKRHAKRRRNKNQPWILVSGIAFVAVAATLWFISSRSSDESVSSSPALDEMPVFNAAREPGRDSGDTAVALQTAAAPLTATTESMSPSVTAAFISDAAIDIGGASLDGFDDPQLADSEAATAPPEVTGSTLTLGWRGQDKLELHFSADSWVEVEHRGGAESHRDLGLAGDLLVVDGTAPFAILLGSAQGVEVRLNGRKMDISANVQPDDTARLSLGM